MKHIIVEEWQPVVFAADCDEEGNCPICFIDYADCPCPGPTQDGYEYEEVNNVLYARPNREEAGVHSGGR